MPQKSRLITMRMKSPLSPAERAERYQRLLLGPRGSHRVPVKITEKRISALVKRGYLGADERDDLNAIGQAMSLFLWDAISRQARLQGLKNARRRDRLLS